MTYDCSRPRRVLPRAALFALLFPLALPAQRQNGLLEGRVLSGDVAVPGAAVFVSGGRVTIARVDGRFRLSLPPGRYEVRAQRIGYVTARDSVTVSDAAPATLNFRLDRTPSPLEAVATLGTRTGERSVIEAMDPVEVIDGTTLRATGRVQTSQALQAAQPSVNLSHATVGQGTDLLHPFTLRGLGPDQVLVLVNGKRRHGSALVNLTASTARGASGVDLDAIPVSMIERIEVLHGNAVAQYGADALAGVVNVVLKSGVHGFATSTAGSSLTTFNRDESPAATPYFGGGHAASDGRQFQAAIDKGLVFGERGFLHGALELRDRGATDRNLRDPLLVLQADTRVGDPYAHDGALFLNGGNLFANGLEAYGDLGGSRRTIAAPTPAVGFTTTFVPVIDATSADYAGTVGLRGRTDHWRWDLGTVYGWNSVGLAVSPAISPIIGGPRLPTVDAGGQRFSQSTTTLELSRDLAWFEETRLVVGGELRRDAYRVTAGEPASYAPTPQDAPALYGLSPFTPVQETTRSRVAAGGHLGLEADLSDAVQLGMSGRVERYDDVGTQAAGKLNARYEPSRRVVFRGSVARGFRAPTLQQSSLTMVFAAPAGFVGPVLELALPTDPRVVAVGAQPLRAERTLDFQLGTAIELTPRLSVTLDGFRTDIKDRILAGNSYYSFNGAPYLFFFGNPVDTRTTGLDLTTSYALRFGSGLGLRLAGAANVSHTRVTRGGFAGDTTPVAMTPRENLLGSATMTLRQLGAMVRTQRYGMVRGLTDNHAYPARWVTDASLSYTLARKYTLTAGADNLLDTYPERAPALVSPLGFPMPPAQVNSYDASSPFGFNGRYVYGRLSIYL